MLPPQKMFFPKQMFFPKKIFLKKAKNLIKKRLGCCPNSIFLLFALYLYLHYTCIVFVESRQNSGPTDHLQARKLIITCPNRVSQLKCKTQDLEISNERGGFWQNPSKREKKCGQKQPLGGISLGRKSPFVVLWRVGGVLDLSGRFDLLNTKRTQAAQKYYRLKYFFLIILEKMWSGRGRSLAD